MGRKNPGDRFREECIPTREEVDAFDPASDVCCTLAVFKPDLRGDVSSKYNRAVGRVFAEGFNESQRYSRQEAGLVERLFIVHLKQLRKLYKSRSESQEEKEAAMRKRRRTTRKLRVCVFLLIPMRALECESCRS